MCREVVFHGQRVSAIAAEGGLARGQIHGAEAMLEIDRHIQRLPAAQHLVVDGLDAEDAVFQRRVKHHAGLPARAGLAQAVIHHEGHLQRRPGVFERCCGRSSPHAPFAGKSDPWPASCRRRFRAVVRWPCHSGQWRASMPAIWPVIQLQAGSHHQKIVGHPLSIWVSTWLRSGSNAATACRIQLTFAGMNLALSSTTFSTGQMPVATRV